LMSILARSDFQPRQALSARLASLKVLDSAETSLLRSIEERPVHSYRVNSRLLTEGAPIGFTQALMSGWACRVRHLADGRRQVIAIVLPGDVLGLCPHERPLSTATVTATTLTTATDARELSALLNDASDFPNLGAALRLSVAEDEHYLLSQIMRLGRQSAYERIAHLFCELKYRMVSRDLAPAGVLPMPLTQETLADVVGLSVVHVNRILQQMRAEGVIEVGRGRLRIQDEQALIASAEFSPPKVTAYKS
jgi:CRP-like cAMP-binding protein